jgi:hypothetical protein
MIGARISPPTEHTAASKTHQYPSTIDSDEWYPRPPHLVSTPIPSPSTIRNVSYNLHIGKQARGWRALRAFADGQPSIPNLRSVRVIIDGSVLDKLTSTQCRDFRLAAEMIGLIEFRVERVEVVYLAHRRTGDEVGEPDERTFARDEVQECVVRGIGKAGKFGEGRVTCESQGDVWPGRKVVVEREGGMRLVHGVERWESDLGVRWWRLLNIMDSKAIEEFGDRLAVSVEGFPTLSWNTLEGEQ